ncbi:MAG: 1-deoxy-D-xylulose-5-phosphate reductoisomerase [Thermomicrobiales bacterium]
MSRPLVPLLSDPIPHEKHPGQPLGVAILGSTGSIGRQTVDVIEQQPERLKIVALAAGTQIDLLADQTNRHQPDLIAVDADPEMCKDRLSHPRILFGEEGLIAVATHPAADIVVVATSGHAAIIPTARAIEAEKTIALANKETIVCSGALISELALRQDVRIRPVDSEHSAIWQCLGRSSGDDIHRLILTASGGPFRQTSTAQLARVTAAEALSHPTWSMGEKITIDSATLMNKGLELIEAHWLFGVPFEAIEVLVHPESIVHSLVEFLDSSQIAQLSMPDMRLPIQYSLTYPERTAGSCRRLSLAQLKELHFEEPDLERFPCLAIARQAGVAGGTYPTVLSAADEVAVAAFTKGTLPFTGIAETVKSTLDAHKPEGVLSWDAIARADRWARDCARKQLSSRLTS